MTRRRVKAREEEYGGETWAPEKYFDNYDMPGKRMIIEDGNIS